MEPKQVAKETHQPASEDKHGGSLWNIRLARQQTLRHGRRTRIVVVDVRK